MEYIPTMLGEAYPTFASLASTNFSKFMAKAIMALVAITAYQGISPVEHGCGIDSKPQPKCGRGSPSLFHSMVFSWYLRVKEEPVTATPIMNITGGFQFLPV